MRRLLIVITCFCVILAGCGEYGHKEQAEKYDVHNSLARATTLFYSSDNKPASMFGGVTTSKNMVGLCFEGLPEKSELDRLLDLLRQYNVKATFFIDGIQAVEKEQCIKKIVQQGHDVQNYTLHAEEK